MRFYSKYFALQGNSYNFDSIFDIEGAIRKIFIASAYTDVSVLRHIFNIFQERHHGSGAILSIFIDKYSNQAIGGQDLSRQYRRLSTEIKNFILRNTQLKSVDKSGIFVVKMARLFHSKLIYIETSLQNRLIVGSMNLTEKGTGKDGNEEFFCIKDNLNNAESLQITQYMEKLSSAHISQDVHSAHIMEHSPSLRDFFLSGKLFTEIGRYNGLFNFQIPLPKDIYERKIEVHPFIDSNIVDRINILKLCGLDPDEDGNALSDAGRKDSEKSNWKSFYCIGTDYGYWCPAKFLQNVRDELYKKDSHSENLLAKISVIPTEDFKDRASSFFDAIRKNLKKYDIDWEIDNNLWEKWLERLINKLFERSDTGFEIKEEMKNAIISGVYEAIVPDFWYNARIYNDFEDSFLNSIQREYAKKSSRNKVIRTLGEDIQGIEDLEAKIKSGITF